jgi:aminopeptidase-like protein
VRGAEVRIGPIERALRAQPDVGERMMALARELFPLPRSLTGEGVRATLRVIGEWAQLQVTEVPSGSRVFDWTAPQEWSVREAWVRDADGRLVVDAAESPLRLLGYSAPFEANVTGAELLEHLYSLPEHPEWIPYRTSYYDPAWGFCVTERERQAIDPDETYQVHVDTTLRDGSVTLGEHVVPGAGPEEVLVSTYTCHPSVANDNVSGLVVAAALACLLPRKGLRRTHRVLFAPSTIGALAWLQRNERRLDRVHGGLIVSCVGDAGPLRYKRSRRGRTDVDLAAELVLRDEPGSRVEPFVPWGGDERQFCSPGFDLAFGSLSRTPHGAYPEYHTSADDLDLIGPDALTGSLLALGRILDVLDANRTLVSTAPFGEPQLGRRGLYDSIGSGLPTEKGRRALLWVLNLADGEHSLLDVAERSGMPFWLLHEAAESAARAGLVRDA